MKSIWSIFVQIFLQSITGPINNLRQLFLGPGLLRVDYEPKNPMSDMRLWKMMVDLYIEQFHEIQLLKKFTFGNFHFSKKYFSSSKNENFQKLFLVPQNIQLEPLAHRIWARNSKY